MLGNFITRGLLLFLGYAYPAFECFKIVEKNRVEIEELRFWCQYWIIVALLTVFERIGDIFVSWLPFYGETKLVLFIYLWYPKTKGTAYVYNTFLRPYVSKHETDIDRNLQEMRARAWDMLVYYWQNCAKTGQATISQIIHFLLSQSSNVANASSEKGENPSSPQPNNKQKQQESDKNLPPFPPPTPTANRAVAQTPKSSTGTVHLHSQAEFIHTEADSVTGPASTDESVSESDQSLHAARLRLRRSKGLN